MSVNFFEKVVPDTAGIASLLHWELTILLFFAGGEPENLTILSTDCSGSDWAKLQGIPNWPAYTGGGGGFSFQLSIGMMTKLG